MAEKERILPRPPGYYGQLRAGLIERFQGYKQLTDFQAGQNMRELSESDLLKIGAAQAALWLIKKEVDSIDLDEGLKAFPDTDEYSRYDVLIALGARGFIHRPVINGPIQLTQKGKDYLGSGEID